MLTRLPSKIKIGGHWYKITFPYKFTERTDIDGQTDHDTLDVKISNGDGVSQKLAESKIMEIFFHEVIHTIDHVYNASGLDEPTVKRLAQGLYQFLMDNGYLDYEPRR
jgi:hypothetical protein